MATTEVNNAYSIDEQKDGRRLRNAPLLLFLLAQEGTQEQQEYLFVNELASLIGQQVEQRVLISTAPQSYCFNQTAVANTSDHRLSAMMTDWLNQGVRRFVLAPWGCRQMATPLIKTIISALSTTSGQKVSVTTIPAPSVHVNGVSVRRAFDGFASIQDQLNPLVEQFPGWDREYTLCSAGNVQVVLLCSMECVKQPPRVNILESPIWKALTAALCPEQVRSIPLRDLYYWKRDGHIYERYLVSLLCAVAESL